MRVRPFYCGSQAMEWEGANCDRCTKGQSGDDEFKCDIQQELFEAACGDGTVSAEIAKRMSVPSGGYYIWKCGEWEPTEEWKVEWTKGA